MSSATVTERCQPGHLTSLQLVHIQALPTLSAYIEAKILNASILIMRHIKEDAIIRKLQLLMYAVKQLDQSHYFFF